MPVGSSSLTALPLSVIIAEGSMQLPSIDCYRGSIKLPLDGEMNPQVPIGRTSCLYQR
jgi:uncharacterized membrane protein